MSDTAPPPRSAPPAPAAPGWRPPARSLVPARRDEGEAVSSGDRDRVAMRLQDLVTEGQIDLDDYGRRLKLALAATTREDLRDAIDDLAEPGLVPSRDVEPPRALARSRRLVVSVIAGQRIDGRWRPENPTRAVAVLSRSVVDLTAAEFDGDELCIEVGFLMGIVTVVVPRGVEVAVDALVLFGSRSPSLDDDVRPGTPLVRVGGLGVIGELNVQRPQGAPGEERTPLRPAGSVEPILPAPPKRRRRRALRWPAAILAAGALWWGGTSDQVAGAVFGSRAEQVSASALEDGEHAVLAPGVLGSLTIEVPEGVAVEIEGAIVLGTVSCPACSAEPGDDGVVRVRVASVFSDVTIRNGP